MTLGLHLVLMTLQGAVHMSKTIKIGDTKYNI